VLSQDVITALLAFRSDRDWEQFHTARSLATALSVEAAELLEHFIWLSDEQVPEAVRDHRMAIEAEVADIAILLTYLVHDLEIDLGDAVSRKMEHNAKKYPLDLAKGSNRKYTDL
jgi:NTP pyrophosphatase (non-canonical NTP hydrolase)